MLISRQKLPKGFAIASQSAEFWRRLAPELTISDAQPKTRINRNDVAIANDRLRMVNVGFIHLKPTEFAEGMAVLAKAMDRIVKAGLPPAFIGIYDEVWSLVAQLTGVMEGLFNEKAVMLPNFWATHS